MQLDEAAVRVVTLLATVVGLDGQAVRRGGVARLADCWMQEGRDLFEQGGEGHAEGGFGVDSRREC